MKDQPKRIFLQVDADGEDLEDVSFNELSGISWCADRIFKSDLEYIMIEDYERLKADNDRYRIELEKIEYCCARHEHNTVACLVRDAANKSLQQSKELLKQTKS